VEHDYAQNWIKFKHALRQRNKLLKSRQDLKLLDYWDQHLIEPSLEISKLRQRYSLELESMLQELTQGMLEGIPVSLVYQQGWTDGEALAHSLEKTRERDIKTGFTNIGIHRDDLKLTTNGIPVIETLSRGQSKRLCLALLLSALKLVNDSCQNQIILLIDDLHSELDEQARNKVYQQLLGLDLQLFVSNIKTDIAEVIRGKEYKMFHVEHGIIKPQKFS
jgi:DNA replication and repair protein RecF